MGILIALLLAAASPRISRKHATEHEKLVTEANKAIENGILWILIIILLFLGISHYARYPMFR